MSGIGNAIGKVVGGITGAKQAADGATQAANTQAQSAADSNALLKSIYDQQRSDNEPWRQAGITALGKLTSGDIDLTSDPSYQFRLNQGLDSVQNSAAARGSLLSGSALKSLNNYAQDQASTEYSNAWNRLGTLAGVGQTANSQNASSATNYGNQAANNLQNAGNARASGYIAQGNVVGNTWNSLGGLVGAASAFSDRRLKTNIQRIGTHASGLPWYRYEIFGQPSEGVMADEVMAVRPDAVKQHSSGFYMVDYGAL